ncbi:MAG: UDP-3-O-acyl-N-acetylglucosamine deacetylase [Rubripirellula sp.]|nr:UDP-3-O-acyl-N-acetylglucosamine deacetylase [Rubripirellula sp.]
MNPSRHEHTIAGSCQITGRGYWTGQTVTVEMHPAAHGSGIRMIRSDLPSRPECPANVQHREAVAMRTNLINGEARFQMVEHLMAALAGMEIDNCIVEVSGEELPGLDGSSLGYVEQLATAGLIIQAQSRKRLVIRERYRIGQPDSWVELAPSVRGESYFEYQLSFDDETPIVPQASQVDLTPDRFMREIAPARTFVTTQQAEAIRSAGVGSHVTNQDLLVIGEDGPIDNRFRFTNECARHKTLDLIGDLALSGVDIVGRVTSFRGGHRLNGEVASRIAAFVVSESSQSESIPTNRIQRTEAA